MFSHQTNFKVPLTKNIEKIAFEDMGFSLVHYHVEVYLIRQLKMMNHLTRNDLDIDVNAKFSNDSVRVLSSNCI